MSGTAALGFLTHGKLLIGCFVLHFRLVLQGKDRDLIRTETRSEKWLKLIPLKVGTFGFLSVLQ